MKILKIKGLGLGQLEEPVKAQNMIIIILGRPSGIEHSDGRVSADVAPVAEDAARDVLV
jgi:hypothetical protein